ncbi:hypothetical protein F5B18DRAFT_636991 [Nemania serpens]|nr:hypothetical protein F5B18DRAFT_636991 [Nemania serpens]
MRILRYKCNFLLLFPITITSFPCQRGLEWSTFPELYESGEWRRQHWISVAMDCSVLRRRVRLGLPPLEDVLGPQK